MKKSVFFLACLVCLCGCRSAPPPAADTAPKPEVQVTIGPVKRETVRELLPVTGVLSPLPDHEAKVSPLAAGRIQRIFVKVGDHVNKGQVLAQLDPGSLTGQVAQASAAVRSAEETLKQSRLNYALQQSNQASSIRQAEQNVRAQQVALSKLLAGSRPQEVAQAQSALTSAQAALTNAQQNLARSRTLFAEGLLATKDLQAAEAQQTSAAAQVRSAQEALSLVRSGNRPEDIQAGRVALRLAEEQLRAARGSNIQNNVKAQDVQIAQHQVQSAQGALKAAQAQLSSATIRAPLSGVVVGRTINPGEWVDTAGSVCTIADLAAVRLQLNVPAAQIEQVHAGETVEFTVETAPGRVRYARVSVVGKAVDPATNAVTVEALADNADRQLRDDGFVKGRIVIAAHDNVFTVPSSAIVQKDGKNVVFVVGSQNVAHATEVKVGLQESGSTEVTGVASTDHVVVTGAYELDDGTKVHPPEKSSESDKNP